MIKKIETDFSPELEMQGRMVDVSSPAADSDIEVGLRPQTLEEYVGQEKVKEKLVFSLTFLVKYYIMRCTLILDWVIIVDRQKHTHFP